MAEFDYIYNNLTADEKMLSDKLGYMEQYKLQNKIGGLFNQPNRRPPLNRNQKIADVLQEKNALRHEIMREIEVEAEKRKVADLLDYAREYMSNRQGMQSDQPPQQQQAPAPQTTTTEPKSATLDLDIDRRTLLIMVVVLACVCVAQYFHCQSLVEVIRNTWSPSHLTVTGATHVPPSGGD